MKVGWVQKSVWCVCGKRKVGACCLVVDIKPRREMRCSRCTSPSPKHHAAMYRATFVHAMWTGGLSPHFAFQPTIASMLEIGGGTRRWGAVPRGMEVTRQRIGQRWMDVGVVTRGPPTWPHTKHLGRVMFCIKRLPGLVLDRVGRDCQRGGIEPMWCAIRASIAVSQELFGRHRVVIT